MKVEAIEGIGPAHAASLQQAGVATSDALLERAGPKAGRDALAAETGISGKLLLEWVNAADLMRIKGIGAQFSDLLELLASTRPPSWRGATLPASRPRSGS